MPRAHAATPTVSLRTFSDIEDSDVHDFHQIVFGFDGQMALSVAGSESRLGAHCAMLVPAGERHDYRGVTGQNRQLVLDLPATSLAVPQRLFERASLLALDPALQRMIGALATDPRRNDARFAWLAAARLCAALIARRGDGTRHADDAARLDYPRIDAWMRAHLCEPLRVGELAAHCGYGTRRFYQVFSDAFGETPHRYLQQLRLDIALELLDDASRSLSDIALSVGFADQSAFTHAFTARFGVAPGRWRRN